MKRAALINDLAENHEAITQEVIALLSAAEKKALLRKLKKELKSLEGKQG